MTSAQRKAIFGMCRNIGMTEDDRRALIFGLTGKDSTKELTDGETEAVIKELKARCGDGGKYIPPEKRNPKAYHKAEAGMMTTEQQSLAWRLMYRLQELDEKPMLHKDGTLFSVGERMAGVIEKNTGNNMALLDKSDFKEHIFDHVHFEDGAKIIEMLKRYVKTAEKRAARKNQIPKN